MANESPKCPMTKGDEPEAKTCPCGEPHDGWPGENGEELCQMCWEAECSKSWWRMAKALTIAYELSEELRRIQEPGPDQ